MAAARASPGLRSLHPFDLPLEEGIGDAMGNYYLGGRSTVPRLMPHYPGAYNPSGAFNNSGGSAGTQ